MGQPDTVYQLSDCTRLLNPKFDAVEKLLKKIACRTLKHLLFRTYCLQIGLKGVTFNLFFNKMSCTSVKMSKIMTKFQFTLSSLLRF